MPDNQIDLRQPERIQWWDIGDGQRAFAGPVERVYAALDIARRRGDRVDVTASVPARRAGYVVVTVRLLPRTPVHRPATVTTERRRSTVALAVVGGVGLGVAGGVVWAAWSLYEALVANLPMLLGAGAVVAGCSVLLVHRGCRIYVTHIRG